MIRALFAATLLACAPMAALAADDSPMMPMAEVYKGPKTETVAIAYFKDGQSAIVQISGVNHAWNETTNKYAVENAGTGKNFTTTVDGAPYVVLTKRSVYGSESVELNMPGYEGNPVPLSFDQYASSEAKPLHMLSAYKAGAK